MTRGTVLVTGASTGIGAAVATRLDRLGFDVLAGVRTDTDADRVERDGSRVRAVRLDVTSSDQIAATAATIDEVSPRGLAGLVNNAGVARGGPLEHLDLDQLREQLEVNLIGQLAVTQAVIPQLRRATGRIAMIGSLSSQVAAPNMGPYSASKAALGSLTEALRAELHQWGIRVALIEPGAVRSEIWAKGAESAARIRAELSEDARRDYAALLDHTESVIAKSEQHAAPASKVADAVEHALTARRPRPRYVVGTDARVASPLLRVLPARLRAAVVRRI